MNDDILLLSKLVGNLYRSTQSYMDKQLKKYHLTSGMYPFLFQLSSNEGINQNNISRELSVDKAMSARVIKKLIALGYVRKEENKSDIRSFKLFLTDKGENIIPDIKKIISQWIYVLAEGYNESEKELVIKFLIDALEKGKSYKESN